MVDTVSGSGADVRLWRLRQLTKKLGWELQLSPFRLRRLHPYHRPRGPERHLDPAFFAETTLTASDDDQAAGELFELWCQQPGGHKCHQYFSVYESALAGYRDRPATMLEIGVQRGGSTLMWQKYLPAGSTFVGIDINPACAAFENPGARAFIRIGDQSDPKFLDRLVEEFGPFDIILDDGSHRCGHMIASFNHLFLNGLKSPGVYLAEDLQTAFWPSFRDLPYSFIDLAKDLVDLMHTHYVGLPGEPFFRKGHSQRAGSVRVPRIATEIESIDFHDSIVAIHKRTRSSMPLSEWR